MRNIKIYGIKNCFTLFMRCESIIFEKKNCRSKILADVFVPIKNYVFIFMCCELIIFKNNFCLKVIFVPIE